MRVGLNRAEPSSWGAILGRLGPGQAALQADMTELICSAYLAEDAAGCVGILKK